jgi:hypothetical protein
MHHVVVNHLPIKPDADWAEIARLFGAFAEGVKAKYPGMVVALLNRASDTEALFVGIYTDAATMKEVSSNVAAPWFAENIRPFLGGPAARTGAQSIAGFVR